MQINNNIHTSKVIVLLLTFSLLTACKVQQNTRVSNDKKIPDTSYSTTDSWTIESQEDWQANMAEQSNLDITKGKIMPTEKEATFKSSMKIFTKKQIDKFINVLNYYAEYEQYKNINKYIKKLNKYQTIQILFKLKLITKKSNAPISLLKNILFTYFYSSITIS